jgi:hypothetical protein
MNSSIAFSAEGAVVQHLHALSFGEDGHAYAVGGRAGRAYGLAGLLQPSGLGCGGQGQ